MTDATGPCPQDDRLVELALGESTGRERADVLAHLLACRACRARVEELVGVAEQLLLAAPDGEPPVGFESAVLDRLVPDHASPRPVARPRPGGRRLVVMVAACAVAAAVLVATGVGVDRLVTRDGGSFAEAAMVTPGGHEVGTAWRSSGDPSWILVSVPDWELWEDAASEPLEYRLLVGLDDGSTGELGPITFDDDGGTWATTTTVDTRRIRTMAVVDGTGRVWCQAEF